MARIVLVPVVQNPTRNPESYTLSVQRRESNLVSRRTFHGIGLSLLLAAGLLLAGCSSSKHPADSGPDPIVDWDALALLFDDPLFTSLPLRLSDQGAAQPLVAAETALVNGIRARDLDDVLSALSRIRVEREAYASCPCSIPGDRALLAAISLFETRGQGILAHVTTSAASAATTPETTR